MGSCVEEADAFVGPHEPPLRCDPRFPTGCFWAQRRRNCHSSAHGGVAVRVMSEAHRVSLSSTQKVFTRESAHFAFTAFPTQQRRRCTSSLATLVELAISCFERQDDSVSPSFPLMLASLEVGRSAAKRNIGIKRYYDFICVDGLPSPPLCATNGQLCAWRAEKTLGR